MPQEPAQKRAVTFFDGQNLFHCAHEAFGHYHPNYDPMKLSHAVCQAKGWQMKQARFYTGVPSAEDDERWYKYWGKKKLFMSRTGVNVFSRPLRYRNKKVKLPDGTEYEFRAGEEKGIDVRISIDLIRMALDNDYDVAVIFSQDQDLSEVAAELRKISARDNRWIKSVCAYPVGSGTKNRRGINDTEWFKIDQATYDACLDTNDYR